MELLAYCQHCGNTTTHSILNEVQETEYAKFDDGTSFEIDYTIWFTNCNTCKQHSLFSAIDSDMDEAFPLFPSERRISENIPLEIKTAYQEALKVRKHSSYAFTVLIRRALEITCQMEKAEGKNLFEKIKDLGSKNILPKKLTDMADLIRLIGNTGAHSQDLKINENELNLLHDFFIAIIEYIYSITEKIELLRRKLKTNT